jgi:uncharacterized protein YbbC (DUF1343 family)
MQTLAPRWLEGCRLRACWFEPTFHKHAGQLCSGLQIHVDGPFYAHEDFKPWRLQTLAFKAIRRLWPEYALWRDFGYEYEFDRLAIDLINGSDFMRLWVDDPGSKVSDLESLLTEDEALWRDQRAPYLLYP